MMNNQYEWVIDNKNELFSKKIKDFFSYQDLVLLLIKKDFTTFYKQTILGPLWYFIQPIFTTVIFIFVFGRIGGMTTNEIPRPLFYMSGIILWNYFSDCVIKTSTVFKDNADLFGKVYFPRMVIPVSIVISNLVKFLVQFMLFIVLLVYYTINYDSSISVNIIVLLIPILILFIALIGLGIGMIISAFTRKYRDLSFLVIFFIQILMFTTTVAYPLSMVNQSSYWFVVLNPMTSIIETFRFGFLGKGTLDWISLGYTCVFSVFILFIGLYTFNKVERKFIDTV